jgi:hypothetical protein
MKNGYSATIHEIDSNGDLLGILSNSKNKFPAIWDHQGKFISSATITSSSVFHDDGSCFDLMPVMHSVWINAYKTDIGYKFDTYSDSATANSVAHTSRIACFKVEFQEGQGIEHLLP